MKKKVIMIETITPVSEALDCLSRITGKTKRRTIEDMILQEAENYPELGELVKQALGTRLPAVNA